MLESQSATTAVSLLCFDREPMARRNPLVDYPEAEEDRRRGAKVVPLQ